MFNTVEEGVVQYLESNREELLDSWMQKVIVDVDDPYDDVIRFNGFSMITLAISCLFGDEMDDGRLDSLAEKVSLERLKANVNMGNFVYNVNIGRSEIFSHLHKMGFTIEELHPIIRKVNDCFDKFLYFTVQHYTKLRDRQLHEQSSFIQNTHKDHLTILGQMSSSFVHEFRNPLTSVIGFVQLLKEKHPTLEYLDVLTKELNQLSFRINQFLLVSKKGVQPKEKTKFHLGQMFDETLDFLYPMVVSSDVRVEMEVDDRIYLEGYRDEFRQVLINIIMNSLDALSDQTEKTVRIRGGGDHREAFISIANNGPAISPGMISSIFEPFVSTKNLGTGIGLYVCRKILHEHGGTIECESNDEWTTFRMSIPLLPAQATRPRT